MWISDDAGRPIRMNDACRSLFHIDDDADAADYCLFDDPNLQLRGLIPQIESVYRAGKAVRFLLETTTAMLSPRTTSAEQATAITLDLTVAPIKNEFGKVTNAILQHVDMTEQKRSERALRNAEQFTRSIIEQAGEAIVVYDRDFRYLSWNPFAERTTGKKAEEVLGKRSFDIFPHMQAQGVDKFLERALAGESFVSPDIHVVFDPPGKDVWLVGTYSPHRNADGEIIGVIASIRDITERRLAEQQIRDLNEKLQSKILALTQPMGDLSNIQLEDIFNIDEVQKIQDAFAKATGVASVITRPDGTPITRPGNFTHLCEHIIRKTEKGLANCYRSDAALGQRHPDGYCVQPCLSGGLWDAGTSICVGDRHIANWLIGQVLDDSIDREKMMDYAREIGADEEEFRQALAQVPHMSREQFDHVAKALHIIAKQFSTLGLQNVQQARFITERQAAEEKLRQYRDHLEEQVTQRTKELQEVHQEMVRVARQAGMAEIASGVLHNVGNVLNSVRVTTGLLRDHNDKSRSQRLTDVAQMLQAHHDDLCEFLTRDPKGQHIPTYIDKLAQHLSDENSEIGELLKTLVHHVDHISEIIAIQQQYSKAVGVTEPVDIAALVRDALSFTATSRQRHHVDVVVDCQDMPPILLDRHRVLQILLNLITNAKQALKESHADPRTVTIRATHDDTMLRISVSDNGIGFAQELHSRLFTHGFTTKKEGHGFGLHSGFLSAKEMGGSLSATSDGVGRGATFTLELPYRTAEVNHATA
jgi:PAS domain S-box-containing protein